MTTGNQTGTPLAAPPAPPATSQPTETRVLAAPCPKCGGAMHAQDQVFQCGQCEWNLTRVILQQPIAPDQAARLLATGKTDLLNGFVSRKTGRPFTACLVLRDGRLAFEFAPGSKPAPGSGAVTRGPSGTTAPAPDFTGQEPVGKCPQCGGRVFEAEKEYRCEHRGNAVRSCPFQAGKVILEQPVARDQMARLLAGGRTDLLPRFVSRKTGQPFAAFLVLDRSGKVSFAFPPRDKPAGQAGVVVRP